MTKAALMRSKFRAIRLITLATLLLATGCSLVEDAVDAGKGGLTVMIHDQAGLGISEAHVTFSALELRILGTDLWQVVVTNGLPTVDLVPLVDGAEATLASTTIPLGDYDGMRLTIDRVLVILDSANVVDVPTPDAPVVVGSFSWFRVGLGGEVTITLDFSIDASFEILGPNDVVLTPQITVDSVTAR